MGGIVRSVDRDGYFMVRTGPSGPFSLADNDDQPVSQELINEVAEASALMASADNEFLIRMGVRRSLLPDIMYRRSADGSTRRCLTQDELQYYNLTPLVFRPTADEQKPSGE